MPSLKEVLRAKLASKAEYDAALLSVNRRNESYIGMPEKRDEATRALIEMRRAYTAPYRLYDIDNNALSSTTTYGESPDSPTYLLPNGTRSDNLQHSRWWLHREWTRYSLGLYTRTEAMETIVRGLPQYCMHQKVEGQGDDPLAVWYTPDPQAGERDAQVRTTLGRFVRKFYPHAPDEEIRDIEAAHRAEVLDEVEFIPSDQIAAAYDGAQRATSCMTHPRANWKVSADADDDMAYIHPTAVYDAPGFSMAVVRDGEGNITGRTLVWVNPEDESDKRFVRVYGDPALAKRLARRGYRLGGLDGARIRRIRLYTQNGTALGENAYLMPYLDAPGGGSSSYKCGQHVLLDRDERYIYVCGQANPIYKRVVRAGFSPRGGAATGGYVGLAPEFNVDAGIHKCYVSGVSIDDPDDAVSVLMDGKLVTVCPDVLAQLRDGEYTKLVYVFMPGVPGRRGDFKRVWAPGDTKTFVYFEDDHLDDEATRQARGFFKLSEKFYPPDTWCSKYEVAALRTGEHIKSEDEATVIACNDDGRPELQRRHVSEVDPKDKARFVPVHRINTDKALYVDTSAGEVKIERTVSGRRVVRGIHDLVELYDGTLEFSRNAVSWNYMGMTLHRSRKVAPSSESLQKHALPKVIANIETPLKQAIEMLKTNSPEDVGMDYVRRRVATSMSQLNRSLGGFLGVRDVEGEGQKFVDVVEGTQFLPLTARHNAQVTLRAVMRGVELWESDTKPSLAHTWVSSDAYTEYVQRAKLMVPGVLAMIDQLASDMQPSPVPAVIDVVSNGTSNPTVTFTYA